ARSGPTGDRSVAGSRGDLVPRPRRRLVRGADLPRAELRRAAALHGAGRHLHGAAPTRPDVRAGAVCRRRRAGAVERRARPVGPAAGRRGRAVSLPYRPFDGDAWLGRDLPLDGGPYQIVPESAFAVAEEIAFARQGRKARVFKLRGPDGATYALKTFYRGFSLA